jgi:hypothetical protein
MNWTLIRHVPPVLMVLPWEMPSQAADVELYGESDCGEEMRLELPGRPEPTWFRPEVPLNATTCRLAIITRRPAINSANRSTPLVVCQASSAVKQNVGLHGRGRRQDVDADRWRSRHVGRRAS